MKEKDYVVITYTKTVYDCEQCDNSDYDNGKLMCCSLKLSYKKYPSGREIDDEEFKEGQSIPSWCPYRNKRRK